MCYDAHGRPICVSFLRLIKILVDEQIKSLSYHNEIKCIQSQVCIMFQTLIGEKEKMAENAKYQKRIQNHVNDSCAVFRLNCVKGF